MGWRRAQAFYRPVTGQQSPQRVYLLSILRHQETVGVSALARAMDLDVASASGLVARMHGEGLVTRRRSKANRAEVLVGSTAAGRAFHDELIAKIAPLDAKLLKGLSKSDIDSLRRVIDRIETLTEENVS
jgi:DNA-binding MarR family transcriptional regulator